MLFCAKNTGIKQHVLSLNWSYRPTGWGHVLLVF